MTFVISKDFTFAASHVLNGLAEGHKCGRLHGHNYVVRVELSGPLNDVGFVVDYGDLAPFGEWINNTLDHRHLNDVLTTVINPTAENLALILASELRDQCSVPSDITVAVGVSETPKTWAWYR